MSSSTPESSKPTALTYTLASRASQLAQIQTHIVRDKLLASFPSTPAQTNAFETRFMRTAGDKNQKEALYVIGGGPGAGGKALWTEELEAALLRSSDSATMKHEVKLGAEGESKEDEDEDESAGRVDMLVHSLKDVPTTLPAGCEIGAILEREDPVDSLVVKHGLPYKNLDELPDGSVVGTSSIRRVAQLRRKYPKLEFADVVSRPTLNLRIAAKYS